MSQRHLVGRLAAGLIVSAAIGTFALARERESRSVNGTIWAANRGTHTIRAFDADTGEVVRTVNMAPNSQPGDLAAAKGKLYVAEEFGTPPAIAIVDLRDRSGAPYQGTHSHRGGDIVENLRLESARKVTEDS